MVDHLAAVRRIIDAASRSAGRAGVARRNRKRFHPVLLLMISRQRTRRIWGTVVARRSADGCVGAFCHRRMNFRRPVACLCGARLPSDVPAVYMRDVLRLIVPRLHRHDRSPYFPGHAPFLNTASSTPNLPARYFRGKMADLRDQMIALVNADLAGLNSPRRCDRRHLRFRRVVTSSMGPFGACRYTCEDMGCRRERISATRRRDSLSHATPLDALKASNSQRAPNAL